MNKLPNEILSSIFILLYRRGKDLYHVQLCCKRFFKIVNSTHFKDKMKKINKDIWNNEYYVRAYTKRVVDRMDLVECNEIRKISSNLWEESIVGGNSLNIIHDSDIVFNKKTKVFEKFLNRKGFDEKCEEFRKGVDGKKLREFKALREKFFDDIMDLCHFHALISSSQLLYRLRCLFPYIEVNKPYGYKSIWQINLKNVKNPLTRLEFFDFKGRASVRLFSANGEIDDDMDEVILLLNVLVRKQIPHPYDEVVAGTFV